MTSVVVTRRRHPLEGQSLRELGRMRRHGRLELLLVLPDGSKSLIPAAWTGPPTPPTPTPPPTPGLATTLLGSGVVGTEHNYRETVAPWFRSVFALRPDTDRMSEAPFAFQLHTLIGMLLFAIWPFTRLVHAFSAPVGYLFRPYVVYRSRDAATRRPRRGWERIR